MAMAHELSAPARFYVFDGHEAPNFGNVVTTIMPNQVPNNVQEPPTNDVLHTLSTHAWESQVQCFLIIEAEIPYDTNKMSQLPLWANTRGAGRLVALLPFLEKSVSHGQ